MRLHPVVLAGRGETHFTGQISQTCDAGRWIDLVLSGLVVLVLSLIGLILIGLILLLRRLLRPRCTRECDSARQHGVTIKDSHDHRSCAAGGGARYAMCYLSPPTLNESPQNGRLRKAYSA